MSSKRQELRGSKFRSSELQTFSNSRAQSFRRSKPQSLKSSELQSFRSSEAQRLRASEAQSLNASGAQRLRASEAQGFRSSEPQSLRSRYVSSNSGFGFVAGFGFGFRDSIPVWVALLVSAFGWVAQAQSFKSAEPQSLRASGAGMCQPPQPSKTEAARGLTLANQPPAPEPDSHPNPKKLKPLEAIP